MKKKLVVGLILVALVCLVSGVAFADEDYSGSGTIVSYKGNSIVFSSDGESITLAINEDTEISGELKAGVAAYIEWKGNTATYIETEEGGMGDDE